MILGLINLIFWGLLGIVLSASGLRVNDWKYWAIMGCIIGIHLTAFPDAFM